MATQRKHNFKNKNTLSPEQARNRRQRYNVEIRKQIREQTLYKRRNIVSDPKNADMLSSEKQLETIITDLITQISSDNVEIQCQGAAGLVKLLSLENTPIQQVIQTGVLSKLVQFMWSTHPTLQYEAASAIMQISCGNSEQTMSIIRSGAIPPLIQLILSTDIKTQEQAVWALGNIAGDSPFSRDLVLDQDILPPLLSTLQQSQKRSLVRTATWALCNLCRGKRPPEWSIVSPAIPVLADLLDSTDTKVLVDACWSLFALSSDPDHIQTIIEASVCRRLVHLLKYDELREPALRCIGNIAAGDNLQAQAIIDCGVLSELATILDNKPTSTMIRQETCWIISNIFAGNSDQVDAAIGLLPRMAQILDTETNLAIRKEACWAVYHATEHHTIVDQGVVGPVCKVLNSQDNDMILVALDTLDNILKSQHVQEEIEACGGLDSIDHLQQHDNETIYKKAFYIIDTYFNDDT